MTFILIGAVILAGVFLVATLQELHDLTQVVERKDKTIAYWRDQAQRLRAESWEGRAS